jgi:hypothetical protein
MRPSLTRFEVARFELISTRNVSEGWSYVACDAFPHLSLAHASGYDNPWQKLTASNRDCRKRNFKAHASGYDNPWQKLTASNRDRFKRNFKTDASG